MIFLILNIYVQTFNSLGILDYVSICSIFFKCKHRATIQLSQFPVILDGQKSVFGARIHKLILEAQDHCCIFNVTVIVC